MIIQQQQQQAVQQSTFIIWLDIFILVQLKRPSEDASEGRFLFLII